MAQTENLTAVGLGCGILIRNFSVVSVLQFRYYQWSDFFSPLWTFLSGAPRKEFSDYKKVAEKLLIVSPVSSVHDSLLAHQS